MQPFSQSMFGLLKTLSWGVNALTCVIIQLWLPTGFPTLTTRHTLTNSCDLLSHPLFCCWILITYIGQDGFMIIPALWCASGKLSSNQNMHAEATLATLAFSQYLWQHFLAPTISGRGIFWYISTLEEFVCIAVSVISCIVGIWSWGGGGTESVLWLYIQYSILYYELCDL